MSSNVCKQVPEAVDIDHIAGKPLRRARYGGKGDANQIGYPLAKCRWRSPTRQMRGHRREDVTAVKAGASWLQVKSRIGQMSNLLVILTFQCQTKHTVVRPDKVVISALHENRPARAPHARVDL